MTQAEASKSQDQVVSKKAPKSELNTPVRYELLADLWYDEKQVLTGEIVDDLPAKSVKWLLEGNYIRKVEG